MLSAEHTRQAQKKYMSSLRPSPVYFILLLLLVLFYLAGAWYFRSHFFMDTTINKRICQWKTAEQVEEEMVNEAADYVMIIEDSDGTEYQLTGKDIGFTCLVNGEPETVLENQNIWLWPVSFFRSSNYILDVSYTFDEEKLEAAVDDLLSGQMGKKLSSDETLRIALQIEKAFEEQKSRIVIE